MKILILFCLTLTGCVTPFNPLAAPTKYEFEFTDTVEDPDGISQDTRFIVKAKGRAGDISELVTSLGYEWDEGTGNISVNQAASVDSSNRAEMISSLLAAQKEGIVAGLEIGAGLADETIVPILNSYFGTKSEKNQLRAMTEADRTRVIEEWLSTLDSGPSVLE